MPYNLRPAPIDSWRVYNEKSPEPGYFEFDWLSARHPDLYHRFALASIGVMQELDTLVDLTGLVVVDIGAGTGRSTVPIARKARWVIALDAWASVVAYGKLQVEAEGLRNATYVIGDSARLPLHNASVDAIVCVWATLQFEEAYRVLKPNGHLIQVGSAPGSLCGELLTLA